MKPRIPAFKLNPPPVTANGDSHYRLDIEICKALRKALATISLSSTMRGKLHAI